MAYTLSEKSDKILEVDKLRKSHPNHDGANKEDLTVIDNVSFDVKEGEFVTIIGPSGCGKSTLLSIIAGLEELRLRRHCGKGSQDRINRSRHCHNLSGGVSLPLVNRRRKCRVRSETKRYLQGGAKEDRERVHRTGRIDAFRPVQRVHQLSGGMKQRVAIARGLALNPRILLMDEPFGALDARTRHILQNEVQEIHEKTKKTILFVTHDVREAVSLGDRVIVFTHRPARIKQQYIS